MVPAAVVERLPLYTRVLSRLADEGRQSIRSRELGDLLTLHPEQVRKDLSFFGHLGKPGRGYDVAPLGEELGRVLGLGERRCTVLVGAGNLGRAILSNGDFGASGFDIVAAFDAAPAVSQGSIRGTHVLPLSSLPEFLAANPVEVAIVAVPPALAQAVADDLVRHGVRAILNYAPIALRLPPDVLVRSIDPVAKLQAMAFYLRERPATDRSELVGD